MAFALYIEAWDRVCKEAMAKRGLSKPLTSPGATRGRIDAGTPGAATDEVFDIRFGATDLKQWKRSPQVDTDEIGEYKCRLLLMSNYPSTRIFGGEQVLVKLAELYRGDGNMAFAADLYGQVWDRLSESGGIHYMT